MPTGYTKKLYDGEPQSFKEFALSASRAMGANILMRDDSPDLLPKPYEVPRHYADAVTSARAKLALLRSYSDRDWELREEKQRKDFNDSNERAYNAEVARVERYQSMLNRVNEWEPPTPEHEAFKAFMVDQLEQSIHHDGPWRKYERMEPRDMVEFVHDQLAKEVEEVNYRVKAYRDEVERTRSRNEWNAKLAESLVVFSGADDLI